MRDLAAHTAEILGVTKPVHLLPAGTFQGRDGRGPYRLADADAVIAATIAHYGDALPIDRDHARDFLPAGTAVPAAGWIKRLEARPDGVWGEVEWTDKAAAEIESREYRFLSPVFKHRPDGTVVRLERAALTNYPNLVLEALASQRKESSMDLETELRATLGLADTAAASEIVDATQALAASAASMLATVAQSLGLDETATAAQVTAKAEALAQGDAKPDPARYVPMSTFQGLSSELGQIKREMAATKAAGLVEAAQAAGKVTPAMAEWAQAYAAKDPEGFTAWCAAAPAIVQRGAGKAAGRPKREAAMDEDDLAVCSAMGLEPDNWKKSLSLEVAE